MHIYEENRLNISYILQLGTSIHTTHSHNNKCYLYTCICIFLTQTTRTQSNTLTSIMTWLAPLTWIKHFYWLYIRFQRLRRPTSPLIGFSWCHLYNGILRTKGKT